MSNTVRSAASDKPKQSAMQPVAPRQQHTQAAAVEQQRKQNVPKERVESQTSYAAMLKDAQDGGVDEAYSATQRAHGGSNKENGELESNPSVQQARKLRQTKPAIAKLKQGSQSLDLLKGLRQKKQAEEINATGDTIFDTVPIGTKHDQLMLASSQMKTSEVASHVSLHRFAGLERILTENHWQRNPDAEADVIKIQMGSIG